MIAAPPPMVSTQVIADVRSLLDLLADKNAISARLNELEAAQKHYDDSLHQSADLKLQLDARATALEGDAIRLETKEREVAAAAAAVRQREVAVESAEATLNTKVAAFSSERAGFDAERTAALDAAAGRESVAASREAAAQEAINKAEATQKDLDARLEKLRSITQG